MNPPTQLELHPCQRFTLDGVSSYLPLIQLTHEIPFREELPAAVEIVVLTRDIHAVEASALLYALRAFETASIQVRIALSVEADQGLQKLDDYFENLRLLEKRELF